MLQDRHRQIFSRRRRGGNSVRIQQLGGCLDQLGPLLADPHTFFIEVTDQRVDVRLIPRDGYEKPIINALRVMHRVDR